MTGLSTNSTIEVNCHLVVTLFTYTIYFRGINKKQSKSKVLCLPRVNGLSLKAYFQPCPAYFIEHFMVGVQCLAQGHFSGGNFNVPVRGFELATFRYQDRSPNRSATAALHCPPLPRAISFITFVNLWLHFTVLFGNIL